MGSVVSGWADDDVAALGAEGLLRRLDEPLSSAQGPRVELNGQWVRNFSSNDYLGLAFDPRLREAASACLERLGVGSGASRLVVGDTLEHQALERELADFEQKPAALVFNSGYAANVGVLAALLGPDDVVFSDALNHASIIDGCRLSRARVVIYPHRDVARLEALMASHPGRRRLVVTDAVFSMEGDVAPVVALAAACEHAGAGLMVDEAHATGVLGERGAGLCEQLGVRPDLVMGTLSKAIGAMGGYVACAASVRELLINRARSLVFSTAMPAAMCAAARAGLRALRTDWALRGRLKMNVSKVAEALGGEQQTCIFTVPMGSPEAALAASAALRAQGLLVKAIRPPTVPPGTSRLRIAVTAAHSPDDLDHLMRGLKALGA